MLNATDIKKKVGEYAAQYVENGATVGLGTGSTVFWLLQELGNRVKAGLEFTAVATSQQTRKIGTELGIRFKDLNDIDSLALTIDGADEADAHMHLIKGGGGALLREKMVAAAGKKLIIIVDESKIVTTLGKFPLPVEVIPFGWKQVQKHIAQGIGCDNIVLRAAGNDTFITDEGNYILDCHFKAIEDPATMNTALHAIPGVVETGLFINMATTIITGTANGDIQKRER